MVDPYSYSGCIYQSYIVFIVQADNEIAKTHGSVKGSKIRRLPLVKQCALTAFEFFADKLLATSGDCSCAVECTRNIYHPSISFAALTDNLMIQIVNNGPNPYEKLRNALDVADHIDTDSYVNDMAILKQLSDALADKEKQLCKLLGCENRQTVPTLDIIFESLMILHNFLRIDFEAILQDIYLPFHIASRQIHFMKQSYESFRHRFLGVASYTLQYSVLHDMSFQDALVNNHYDFYSSLQQYYHAFQIYMDTIQNMERMSSGGPTDVELPRSLYRSTEERHHCFDRISFSLDSIRKLSNQTLTVNGSNEHIFAYEDMSRITEVDDICFGDYIVHVKQTIENMRAKNVSRYSANFDILKQKFYSISVHEITGTITQLRRDIEEYITTYSRKDISKLQVCISEML